MLNCIVVQFENKNSLPLVLVIDPPIEVFNLAFNDKAKLYIYYEGECSAIPSIGYRYHENNVVNIDIDYNCQIKIEINGSERYLWE